MIVSYAAWQDRYGGRTDVIGQAVRFNGTAYTIIGVLPAGFHFAPVKQAEVWGLIRGDNNCEKRRSCHNLYAVGRLKDNVTLESASADFDVIAHNLQAQYPDSNTGQLSNIVSLSEVIVGSIQPVLIALLGGSGLLLLIAVVNVANLLLVRSEGRKREIAVRSGLGASPARLAMQFVTEGFLLVRGKRPLGTRRSPLGGDFIEAAHPQIDARWNAVSCRPGIAHARVGIPGCGFAVGGDFVHGYADSAALAIRIAD